MNIILSTEVKQIKRVQVNSYDMIWNALGWGSVY